MGQINLGKTNAPLPPPAGMAGISISTLNTPILVLEDGTEIPLGGTTLEQIYIDALTSSDSPSGSNPYVTISQLQSILGSNNRLLNDVSVQWSGTGLIFDISEAVYYIDGVLYTETSGQIPLDVADVTNPRIDVFYVDVNGFGKLTGTPSATPVKPLVNPLTQIELSFVQIATGATTPTITNENVYLENTEWVTSSTGTGTFNANSTTSPFAGVNAFEVTSIQNGGTMVFTKSVNIDLTTYASLGFHLKLKGAMNNGRNIYAQFFDISDNSISNSLAITIDKSNTSTYQFCGLNLNAFTFSDKTVVRKLKLSYNGNGGATAYTGYYVDNVIIQLGVQNNPNTYLTDDELDAIQGANSPNSSNVFATMSDIVSGGTPDDFTPQAGSTLAFDGLNKYGFNGTPLTGNLTFSITGAKETVMIKFRHNSGTAPTLTPPVGVTLIKEGADYTVSVNNIGYAVCHKNDAGAVTDISYSWTKEQA